MANFFLPVKKLNNTDIVITWYYKVINIPPYLCSVKFFTEKYVSLKYSLLLSTCRYLFNLLGRYINYIIIHGYEFNLFIKPWHLSQILSFLVNHISFRFRVLVDILVVDYGRIGPRFDLTYMLLSLNNNIRCRVTITCQEITDYLVSVESLFPAANWIEREIWDMFGIIFQNSSDSRRILNDYGFVGHPLRKDFPLEGHFIVYYSEHENRMKKVYV